MKTETEKEKILEILNNKTHNEIVKLLREVREEIENEVRLNIV